MKSREMKYDWIRLIEVSGPFLAPAVLDDAFPTGLDGLDRRVKRELGHYYEEWVEAREEDNEQFSAIHRAWCMAVLKEGLGIRDKDIGVDPGSSEEPYIVLGEGGMGRFTPDIFVKGIDGKPALFVKFLDADVKPSDRDAADDWKDTFTEKMTALCRANDVRIGLVTNGEQWTLVNASPAGKLSGTATWYARLWFQEDETLRAFLALLGMRNMTGAPQKRLARLLDESLNSVEEVTNTLGRQVMTAIEVLIEGFDRADIESKRELLRDVSAATLYQAALTVMMRLVFLLCAEERGLLLLGDDDYDKNYAVSTLRGQLEQDKDKFSAHVIERRYDAWSRLLAVFRAVYYGVAHPRMIIPAFGGSLFDPEKYPFLESCKIDNRTVLLLLESLQLLQRKGGAVQLSFRSLDVEQIGYIYEGLIEFTGGKASEILLGMKGDKTHVNPEVALAELENRRFEGDEKLFAFVSEKTGRKVATLEKEFKSEANLEEALLSEACRGDTELMDRVRPFMNWMRQSEWNIPVVYQNGTYYVTEGEDRRATGAHYTPKVLTEMVTKEALEPVVYCGPADGLPRAEWQLKSVEEILNLKVCDLAMGSGAFLVQACRYLGDRLVDAWEIAEKAGKAIDSDGRVVEAPPPEPMTKSAEERLVAARRLVAERCLYGVDINPLAVELAKLSLWLVTLAKDKPFGFLDHNLKCGDSLLGVTDIKQLTEFRMKPDSKKTGNLMSLTVKELVDAAAAERVEIASARTNNIADVNMQKFHHEKAQALTKHVKDYADYFIGRVLRLGKPSKKTDKALDTDAFTGEVLLNPEHDSVKATILMRETADNLAYDLPAGHTAARRPFHWAIEFPEVFANGGFDAICGNPPFMGGQHITGNFGTAYRDYIVNYLADGAKGSADLVAYFYLRAYSLLRSGGCFGLIACNTIAQGDTRQVGLERMVKAGGTIYSAYPNMPWPGVAAVVISPVFMTKGAWHTRRKLNGKETEVISAFLSTLDEWSPMRLAANAEQSYQGSIVLGVGFTLSEKEARSLIEKDSKYTDVLSPYLNGEDLNSDPCQRPSRWVINFFDWSIEHARQYGDVFAIADERVRTERESNNDRTARDYWWRFLRSRSELYHAIGRGNSFEKHPKRWSPITKFDKVLVNARVCKYFTPSLIDNTPVFHEKIIVLTRQGYNSLAFMMSTIIQDWTWKQSSTLGTGLNFSPSDAYETLPFPVEMSLSLDSLGEQLDALRRKIMTSRNIGLTALYNLFHNPAEKDAELEEMRKLQREIDVAVRDSYGWQDIDLDHGFHEVGYLPSSDNVRYTISEPARIEILKRLAALNRQRWEEEEAKGLHKKSKKGASNG